MKIIQLSAIDSTMNGLLRELNTSIQKENYDLICVCSDGPKVNKLRNDGFDVRTVEIDRKISPLRNLRSIFKLYKLFRKEKPDIVHVHTPIASVLGRIAAKFARVPVIIYTAHGFYFHENMKTKQYKFYYLIEKVCAKMFTNHIFTQSAEDGELAINNNFLPEENITIIGNGVDVHNKFNPDLISEFNIEVIKEEFNFKEEDIIISFIGRLVKEKGILDLLEGFTLIKEPNIKLMVIGDISSSERDQGTFKEIEKYRNSPNILFTGYRSDIPELLSVSDIYCLPSYREGMPRSIIEAMAMKNAIIATDIRGSREEVDHGINGYLVNLNSPEDIADSIIELITNPDSLKYYRQESRTKALSLYDEHIVVKKQLEVFEQYSNSKRI